MKRKGPAYQSGGRGRVLRVRAECRYAPPPVPVTRSPRAKNRSEPVNAVVRAEREMKRMGDSSQFFYGQIRRTSRKIGFGRTGLTIHHCTANASPGASPFARIAPRGTRTGQHHELSCVRRGQHAARHVPPGAAWRSAATAPCRLLHVQEPARTLPENETRRPAQRLVGALARRETPDRLSGPALLQGGRMPRHRAPPRSAHGRT